MAVRRSGLGRGLDALLPTEPLTNGMTMVDVDAISANPRQPREHFGDDGLESLAASIKEVGVLQPVVVRPADDNGGHVLVAGERRWRAAVIAGLTEIPALIRIGDDRADLIEALIENVQREDLTPLEEAAAYQELLEGFGLTHEQVGERVGRSRSAVSNALRLLTLPAAVQGLLERGELTAGHGRALAGMEDTGYAEHIASRAAAEGWSVRQVEEAVRERLGEVSTERTVQTTRERPAEILALEERLAERLESGVRIDYGSRGGGKMTVRFSSLDDLQRIYKALLGE